MTAYDFTLRALETQDHLALNAAAATLENPNLAARIAEYAGAPVNRVLAMLPKAADAGLTKATEAAMRQCLKAAIRSLDGRPQRAPRPLLSNVAAGVTGGVSGFMGVAALPIELPITATLMMRAIVNIARHSGEDLTQIEARLACLQVFGLGARSAASRGDIGYFSARTLLTKISGNVAAETARRGAMQLSEAAAGSLLSELAGRFSLVVSDRIAASALPVVGAVGGATVNVVFMNHFQQIAQGHFTVRRLERAYGPETVRLHYAELAARSPQGRK